MPNVAGPRYLTVTDLQGLGLTIGKMADVLEQAFRFKAAGEVVSPPMTFFHRGQGQWFNSMVCWIPSLGYAGCKFQSGDATNLQFGLPSIQGMYMLTESERGRLVALIDARWLTGIRTAAVGALFARRDARPGAATLGILGCGLQGRLQLQAIKEAVPTIRRCRSYDTDPAQAQSYLREMTGRFDVEVEIVDSPQAAVTGADIVMSSGPIVRARTPAIEPGWLSPGCLYLSLDRDCYIQDGAIASMDLILSDDKEALFHARDHEGAFSAITRVDADLSDIAMGGAPARRHSTDRIGVFVNGLGIEDLAAAIEVFKQAEGRQLGQVLQPQWQ
jgi:ornithine cyclodeaminase/alanine dehydrogenase